MTELISAKKQQKANLTILIVSSILITAFLFFIDEGNYNFKWAKDIFHWLIFLVYALPIFLFQFLISKAISKKVAGIKKNAISIIIGALIGITFVIGLIF